MIKNKPFAHVKKGDILVTRDQWGRERRYPVADVEVWEADERYMRIVFPEVKDVGIDGVERIIEDSVASVFWANDQTLYEAG